MIVKCPECKKPVEWKDNPDRPFCSERCRLIDLGAWASEERAVPSDHVIQDDGDDDSVAAQHDDQQKKDQH